jgi:tetratricopeptide (TPR) repeat protein
MRNSSILFLFSVSVSLLISCSRQSDTQVNNPTVKTDTAQNDYLKSVARDPKQYFEDCKQLLSDAKRMDSIIMKEMEVKEEIANRAVKAFTDYAYYCSNDSVGPIFMIKAAQISQSINNIPQAKLILEKCITEHQRFKNLPAALFLLAQLYDDENSYLNNEQEARKLYQQIIDEYPKSDIVPSAKGALMMIGKSDKQLMEELKNKK